MAISGLLVCAGMHALEVKGARNHNQVVLKTLKGKNMC